MVLDIPERTKVLLKAVYDSIRKLDSIYSNGKAIKTVFSYEAYGYRLRLKETLQKLMFLDPAVHARRSEELIWRKVFYEPLHLYKMHIKNNDRPDRIAEFELMLRAHIVSGIGYYQSLLLQIQADTMDDSSKCYAWIPTAFHIPLYNVDTFTFEVGRSQSHALDRKVVQKCLMYIGDLFRYLIEFGESSAKPLAYGYYSAALDFDPGVGLPHNQLGILDVGRCYGLNAIFHYLLCLGARIPFDGARRNLSTVLSKNEVRYHKLFGEKPIFGTYLRHPNRYRPKDFRKTITKFIYLIQQFLKPVSETKDINTSQVFHDTLLELHLMLSISADLLLELGESAEDIKSDSEDGNLWKSRGHLGEHSLFSEHLTGPIFIRILLIALLTADFKISAYRRLCDSLPGEVDKQLTSLEDHQELTCDGTDESAQSDSVEAAEDKQSPGESSKTMNPPYRSPSEAPAETELADPHGPLSFLFHLSELFMGHLCSQLRSQLISTVRVAADVSEKQSRLTDHADGSARGAAECPLKREANSDGVKKCVSNRMEFTSSPPSDDDADAPEDQSKDTRYPAGDGSKDVPTKISESNEDSSDDGDLELFNRHSSSSENSNVDDEESDELESDAELWSSDDSSLLHSQDEAGSVASADEDSETFSDKRLRRAPHVGVRRSTHTVETHTEGENPVPHNGTRTKEVKGSLDTITEEESASEEKRASGRRRSGRKVLSSDLTSDTDTSPHSHQHTTNQMNDQRDSKHTSSHIPANEEVQKQWISSEVTDSSAVRPTTNKNSARKLSSTISSDPVTRTQAVSRLYLLASVKLVLDWLNASNCQNLTWLLPKQTTETAGGGHCPDQRDYAALSVIQRWCYQLAQLLNYFVPIVKQVTDEILQVPVKVDDETSESENQSASVSNLTSPFGLCVIRNALSTMVLEDTGEAQSEEGLKSVDKDKTDIQAVQTCSDLPSVKSLFKYPLPEDWLLRGLASLSPLHQSMDFDRAVVRVPFSRIDEALLRSLCFVSFGRQLARHSSSFGLKFSHEVSDEGPFHSSPPGQFDHVGPAFAEKVRWPYFHRRGRGRSQQFRCHPPNYQGHCRGDYGSGVPHWWSGGRPSNKVDRWGSSTHSYRGHGHRFPGRPYDPSNRAIPNRDEIGADECIVNGRSQSQKIKPTKKSEGRQHHDKRCDSADGLKEPELSKQSSNSSVSLDAHPGLTVEDKQSTDEEQDTAAGPESRRAQVMRDMARLRLLNEVDQLSRQCHNQPLHSSSVVTAGAVTSSSGPRSSSPSSNTNEPYSNLSQNFLSPYVVVDAYCLASHLPWIKQLVNSGCFVLIIPIAVISHLDYLKKSMATARVAIRYLEHEIHSGNRYIRLQKPEEQPATVAQITQHFQPRLNAQSCTTESGVGDDVDSPHSKDSSAGVDTGPTPALLIANPRVVRRWLSILDCATFFSESVVSEGLTFPPMVKRAESIKTAAQIVNSTSDPVKPKKSRSSSHEKRFSRTETDESVQPCYDLLALNRLTTDFGQSSQPKAALVTILIGTRDTNPEDTVVPQEFFQFALKSGVRLELLRDFFQRWRKSNQHEDSPHSDEVLP
ncbi:unnamed protein product [Calicophoron daubneyi]|uniref:PIN domain-containing protein n=1 Tax=Calicophoron daubneyi TaxID=300641 RepID=A0AAV2T254_CALDB